MPEMRFAVRWPDGQDSEHYSPSLVIGDYLEVGESYPLDDFVERSRAALDIASDRVEARYGHPCSRARRSIAQIDERAGHVPDGPVTVLRMHPPQKESAA